MASNPKRRRTRKETNPPPPQRNQSEEMRELVQTCLAATLPLVEETVRKCIENFRQTATANTTSTTTDNSVVINNSVPSTPEITTTSNSTLNQETLSLPTRPSILSEITSTDSAVQNSLPQYGKELNIGTTGPSSSLVSTADFLIAKSLSEESRLSYKKIYKSYQQFLYDQVDTRANPLPPSLTHLVLYIAHCFTQGLAAATARTHVSALGFMFQLGGYSDLTQHFIIKKQLQGYSKAIPSQDARLPITPSILLKIIASIPHVTNSAFIKALVHAMYVLAFCAFLRVGEITKTGKSNQHYLLVKHISFLNTSHTGQSMEVTVPHSKHAIRPTTLQISSNLENPLLCPVSALQKFMQFRQYKSKDEPLFSFMDGSPVSRQFFTHQLRLSLSFCGLDAKLYQSHSFRIGAATAAADSGATDIQIQNMGRWKSTAFKKYIRVPVLTL